MRATRLLAHRLLHRAGATGEEADFEAALCLVDERLAPSPEARRSVAAEARRLCRAALAASESGGPLDGELRRDLRVVVRESDATARVVVIPTLVRHPDGAVSVVAMAPAGEPGAEARARRYRRAARAFSSGETRVVRAFLVRASGAKGPLPDR